MAQARRSVAKSPMVRAGYFAAGLVFCGLGYLGFILPVMPGTIFLILALNCFGRSSPVLEQWLLDRPVIGPILRQWDETGSISRRVKWIILVVANLFIIGSLAGVFRTVRHPLWTPALATFLLATSLGLSRWVWTRPEA